MELANSGRRRCLQGMGVLALLAAAERLPVAAAAANLPGALCLSMVYLKNVRFDVEHFQTAHLPLLRRLYGSAVGRIDLRMAPRSRDRKMVPPVSGIISLYINDIQAFGTVTGEHGKSIADDLAKVTRGEPFVQYDQVVAAQGEDTSAIAPGADCTTFLYAAAEGKRFDTQYYAAHVLPLMAEAYGDSVRRMEVLKGVAAQGGGALPFAATINLYPRDAAAMMAAGRAVGMKLMAETPRYTDILPLVASTHLRAAG
ncbi:MAG: hypothetical protein RL026_2221 [Pseudomonadota bacterium]|jgi:uncharacterized protein (TIGR02118 family)